MTLPRLVGLKSKYNNKYLHYIHEDGKVHGFVQFSGEEVARPYAKFEVEMAKSGNGLVHIRCCYNNKYWVRSSQNDCWIVVAANEPEEDQSKWSCTLFKPVYVDGDAKTVRFLHVQLGHYASLRMAGEPYDACLFAGSKDPSPDLHDVCTIIDWQLLFIMPKYVAFKGDNGNYLCAGSFHGHIYLTFASDEIDIKFPTVGNEVFTNQDGSIRIKSNYFDNFWRRSPNWIWADTKDTTTNNPDTLFWPVKVDNNVVALRNLGNNNFCMRLTTEGKTDCLNAAVPTVYKEARMEVEELVFSREIYNVNFRLKDARIYNQTDVTMATGVATNRTTENNTISVKLSYTETQSTTWNNSVSAKLGFKTSLKASIPLIVDDKIEISVEVTETYQWGGIRTSTTVVETTYTAIVPPRTQVTVNLIASRGSCDVPFSYSQRDILFNGDQVIHEMDDGICTGTNSYKFRYETDEEKL